MMPAIERRLMAYDPRYFTTYYAIDAINFTPVDISSALDTLEGPYLPLVVQEAAGLPLDPSFAEQKKILTRCNGLFYGCANGAEARHFNRHADRRRPDQESLSDNTARFDAFRSTSECRGIFARRRGCCAAYPP